MALDTITRIGFILASENVAALADFYTSRLGFRQEAMFDDPPYAILSREGVRLSLTTAGYRADDLPTHEMTVAADHLRPSAMLVFEVADCDAERAALEATGVRFVSTTFRPTWGGARCFFADPENNLIELEQLA